MQLQQEMWKLEPKYIWTSLNYRHTVRGL